ncbi:MAG: hypothetical protein RMJ15_07295 [Nitrososphaerota archaeon]|nr:hypothetical protein [Nitrososphaerota archaeon]
MTVLAGAYLIAPHVRPVGIQEDLTACLIEGSSIIFKFKYENEIEADNSKISVTVNTANIIGALTMKGLALPRLNDKDSYDVYAITGYYKRNPKKAAKEYIDNIRKQNQPKKKQQQYTKA